MRTWILISISVLTIVLAVGTLSATEPDAKELAARGYSTFKAVLSGDEAKLPEAIRYLEESRAADEKNVDNLFNLGRAYFFETITFGKQESIVKAEQAFAKVVELDPKRADALAFHGSILTSLSGGVDLAKFMKGAQELKAAVQQAPEDITVKIVMAFTARNFPPQALAAMGNYDPGRDLQYVSKAFATLSSDFAPHADVVMKAFVAETYKLKGEDEKARSNFQAALNVAKPDDAGQRAGRDLLDKAIMARMKGGEKPIFVEPLFSGCHSCHLSAPEKLLAR